MKCSRTACQIELVRPHAAIWNEPSTVEPRLYCVRCARKIIEFNPSLRYEFRVTPAVEEQEESQNDLVPNI